MDNALVGLGVKPSDRVAAQVEKSVEAIVLRGAKVPVIALSWVASGRWSGCPLFRSDAEWFSPGR